ncbi:regulation of short-term neuronal synaptic plasticity [Homalodisca vitripennis]|nr:regulation of short-term neuronal synaptic plasticity [Homalodisca vitripennis]
MYVQAQERHGTAEDRIQRLEAQVEEKNAELMRLNQRLKMNEEHNTRLSTTVDKLLSESNERLQVHLKERMHALEEKNALSQELEKTRKVMEDIQGEKGDIVKELSKARLEIDNVKRQMLQQEIAFNIQQTDALTRSLSPSMQEQSGFVRSSSHSSFETHSLTRRSHKPRVLEDDPSKEWEKIQQAHVLANVQQAFDVTSDAEGDDNESIFSADILSPSGHTDAQTLAIMLQEQLDAINNEIRYSLVFEIISCYIETIVLEIYDKSIFGADILSPSGHTDAQTLAIMLQEQLDAINNEIRYSLVFEIISCYIETIVLEIYDKSIFGADILSPSGHTDAQTLAIMLQEQLDAINNEIRYSLVFEIISCYIETIVLEIYDKSIFGADILSPSGHTDAQTLAIMLQEQLDAINNEIRYSLVFEIISCYIETIVLEIYDKSIFGADILSPSGHTDAQTLAIMLQEQLDAINNEIRLIQEEKQSTEARAEELESRVGSLEHMNLLARGRSFERSSPPLSGRSTPKSHHSPQRDYLHKYHTVSTAAVSSLSHHQLHLAVGNGPSLHVTSSPSPIRCQPRQSWSALRVSPRQPAIRSLPPEPRSIGRALAAAFIAASILLLFCSVDDHPLPSPPPTTQHKCQDKNQLYTQYVNITPTVIE